LFSFLA